MSWYKTAQITDMNEEIDQEIIEMLRRMPLERQLEYVREHFSKTAALSESAESILEMTGNEQVAHEQFGNYELYLFKSHPMVEAMLREYNIPAYQIAMQREDTDFTDLDQQQRSNPPTDSNVPIKEGMEWIKSTIESWKQAHGQLVAMSHAESKNRMYKAVLKRLGFDYREVTMTNPMTRQEETIMVIT